MFCINVGRKLVGVLLNQLLFYNPGVFAIGFNLSGVEGIVDVVYPVSKVEFIRQKMLEVVLHIEVPYARIPLETYKIQFQAIIVVTIDKRKIREQLLVKNVVPTQVKSLSTKTGRYVQRDCIKEKLLIS